MLLWEANKAMQESSKTMMKKFLLLKKLIICPLRSKIKRKTRRRIRKKKRMIKRRRRIKKTKRVKKN